MQPKGGARQVITAQLCLIELVAWGVLYYSFSVFLPSMQAELGWSAATLSVGFTVALFVSGSAAPFVGVWIDKRGSHGVMIAGAVASTVGVGLWGVAESFPVYLTAWAIIGFGMAGTLYSPAFATVVRVMPLQSRRAILTITVVGALASTVFIPASAILTGLVGWRGALGILALLLATVLVPLAVALPSNPTLNVKIQSDKMSVSLPSAPIGFRILILAFMLAGVTGVAFNTYLIVFLIDQGQPAYAAAGIAGLGGIAKIGGRVAVAAGNRISAIVLVRFCLLVPAVALLLPLIFQGTWGVVLMVVIFAASSGARTILRPVLILEMFGASRFGKSDGVVQFFTTVAKASAPIGFGLLLTVVDGRLAWALLAVLLALSGVLLFFLRKPQSEVAT